MHSVAAIDDQPSVITVWMYAVMGGRGSDTHQLDALRACRADVVGRGLWHTRAWLANKQGEIRRQSGETQVWLPSGRTLSRDFKSAFQISVFVSIRTSPKLYPPDK